MQPSPLEPAAASGHPSPPWNEAKRLAALDAYDILDTPPEQAFEDIVDMAAAILEAPIALVNLLDRDRQWFKACRGLGVQETGLDVSICIRTVLAPELGQPRLVVLPDLSKDSRFANDALVTAPGGLRFYAGAPLMTHDGLPMGTLCVLDTVPRPEGLTTVQTLALESLARQVMVQMDLRRAVAASQTAQAALHESEAKFRAITDSIDQMVWSTRPDGFHDFYNQRWYDYTGVPPGSTDGEAWNGMFHPDDQDRAWATWDRSLSSGQPYHIEYRLRHRSGQYRWVLGRAQPMRDENGRIVRWYGTCTEIEDIVQARDVLARSRKQLEREVAARTAERDQIWRNALDLLMVLNSDGIMTAANPAWTSLLGWEPHEVTGGYYLDFIHPDDIAHTAAAMAVARSQRVTQLENRYRHRDGSYRLISWVTAPQDGIIYASGRDVTAERAAAQALATTQEQLRQSQKMEAVGQLTGGIAHDFNNMLSIVIGSLDLLARRLDPAAVRERGYVDAAMEGARRAAQLTQRLLAFSRQQPLRPEPVDANRLVAGISELLRHSLGADVTLETTLAGGLWWTNTDQNQLENAILNLAVNARDAMPEGGRLTIATSNATVTAGDPDRPALAPGDYVRLTVADNGAGMTGAVAARAFDPFFTTKDVGRGTGLGLSQVYGFVTQSGGHVQLLSEVGSGTTVVIHLPRLHAPRTAAVDAPPSLPPPRSRGNEVVLVVEDQEAVRRISVEALGALGYHVLAAEGAEPALALLAAHPEIALLFTDIVMPGPNGRKLAETARRIRPDLRVLFTTGYDRGVLQRGGPAAAEASLLAKPFTVAALAAKVRAVLDAPAVS